MEKFHNTAPESCFQIPQMISKIPILNHNVSDPPLTFSILFLKGSVLFDYYIPLLSKYPNKRLALSEKV